MESIISEQKVHFFEYMEIEHLQQYIRKGLKYFVNAACNSHPSLVNVRYWVDQITMVLDFLKDIIYLGKYQSSYAEYFYGLQRQDLKESNNISKLRIVWHAFVLTVLPYVFGKIETYYNVLVEEQENEGRSLNLIQRIFTKLYPYLYLLLNTFQTIMKFKYLLFQQSQSYSLTYKISKTKLAYIQKSPAQQGETVYPWQDLIKSPGLLTILLSHKVLTWYFNQKNQKGKKGSKKLKNIEMKDLSPMNEEANQKDNNNQERNQKQIKQYRKNVCLICAKKLKDPTVVKESGYVYCYNCINAYIRQNGRCPISQIPIESESLQLLYS